MSAPYYPYRADKFAPIISIPCTLFFCVIFGFTYHETSTLDFAACVLLAFFILVSIYSLKIALPASKTHITCDSDGIHICEKNVQHSISWNDLSYKYASHDFKGHKCLILSHCELQKNDIKKAIRQNTFTSQVCFDNYYVIYFDWNQPKLVQELERYIDANMGQKTNEE